MTPLEKENASLREQLAAALARGNEAIDLAVEVSTKYGQATGTVAALAGAAVTQKDAAPAKPAPAPAPTPPVPVAPPPPRPSSVPALYALPAHERARVREAYPNIEDELDEAFHVSNRIGNAGRGGASSHRIATFGENAPLSVAAAQEKARADLAGFSAGAPRPIARGTPDARAMQQAALDRQVGWGAALDKTGKAPAPPAPAAKSRALGRR